MIRHFNDNDVSAADRESILPVQETVGNLEYAADRMGSLSAAAYMMIGVSVRMMTPETRRTYFAECRRVADLTPVSDPE